MYIVLYRNTQILVCEEKFDELSHFGERIRTREIGRRRSFATTHRPLSRAPPGGMARSSLLVLALCCSSAAGLAQPTAMRTRSAPAVRPAVVQMMAQLRWSDKILDESLPDPIFDEPTPYKGRVPYGFSDFAEKMNGRAAMMGFVFLFLQELITGKGVLELCVHAHSTSSLSDTTAPACAHTQR